MNAEDGVVHENRLARETSPYLLQHRHNPVDWWPWGPEALAHAREVGKPILLSVGYAACHWCHVMAHESFEDPQTAAVMNDLFVNIKVDREERPDIDQIYMTALHLLGEHGGWPLTMFLTPAGEPTWGGTYFPKTSRYGRPAFVDVLREFARLYREEPHRIEQNRAALMVRLRHRTPPEGAVTIGVPHLDTLAQRLVEQMDPVNGGLRGAPKFPQAALFEFVWRAGERTFDARLFDAVELALDRLCLGGLFDHLAGGFARYSVDERWLVPHFEKMLYDNAQLLDLLALAYARSHKDLYRRSAAKTVAWLRAEMTTPQGAFCSSLDADSEGEEGRYYVWTLAEIEDVLGLEDAAFFAAHFDVSDRGNFEGKNILNLLNDLPRSSNDVARLSMLQSLLHKERSKRIRPSLDDKVLADWNGLMIGALARAGLLLDEPDWITLAEQAYRFVAAAMTDGDRLGHSWRDNRLVFPGLASDYTAMIAAALSLFEATGKTPYRDQALTWQAALDCHYADPATGGYFFTAADAEGLIIRPAPTTDDATPNPNALAATNLIRLAALSGRNDFREQADRLFDGLLPIAAQSPLAHAGLLNALDQRLRAAEIVVTGHGPVSKALVAAALRIPPTRRILLRAHDPSTLGPTHPARNQITAAPEGAAFVCVAERCSLPLTDPEQLRKIVERQQREGTDHT